MDNHVADTWMKSLPVFDTWKAPPWFDLLLGNIRIHLRTGSITCCSLLICFIIFRPDLAVSEMTRGPDGVWRDIPFQQTPVTNLNQQDTVKKASVSKDDVPIATDEVIEQCISHFRANNRKAVECVLRSSNISIDRKIINKCTRPGDKDLSKALGCYISEMGLSGKHEKETLIKFRDESLDMVQKGLKACINAIPDGSSDYQNCFEFWAKKKDGVWNYYQIKSGS